MVAMDDTQLVALAAAGDPDAYGRLFERYQKRIYNYAYGIAGNPEDAKDVAQDAFIKVYEALPRLKERIAGGGLNFAAYLYRTAHNLACNVASGRRRFAPPDELDVRPEDKLSADPERTALLKEQQAKAREAAFSLPEKQRAILQLREIEELSYQEIGEVLDMPKNTVGVLLSRARLRFKGAFRMSHVDVDKLTGECETFLPLLSAYIDDELTVDERARVEGHLEECPVCRLALEEMTEASKSYRGLIPLLPPLALKADFLSRLAELGPPGGAGAAPTEVLPRTEAPGSPGSGAEGGAGAGAQSAGGIGGAGGPAPGGALARWSSSLSAAQKGALALTVFAAAAATVLVAGAVIAVTTRPQGVSPFSLPSQAPTSIAEPAAPPLGEAPEAEIGGEGGVEPFGEPGGEDAGSNDEEPGAPGGDEQAADTEAPSAPRPLSPTGGSAVSGQQVTLTWSGVDDPSGVTYAVEVQPQLGQNEPYGASTIIEGISETSRSHRVDAAGARWRVWAVDGAGNVGPKSSWATFVTGGGSTPSETTTYPPPIY